MSDSASDFALDLASLPESVRSLLLSGDRICHCGAEKESGDDHGMCYPGMD